ncbi:MAG: UbiD family decarboxylase [Chloroflexi bacterium]|nr:UbiD family decarboxylase [Chloroflexota bacterium]
MAFDDLRSFVDALEKNGELVRVKAQVDWDDEIGAIAEESMRRQGPALLFENIKGHEETHGRRVLVNTMVTSIRRPLAAVGLPENTHPLEAIGILRAKYRERIKPRLVSTGPCKEVIEKGDQVNLLEFPTPRWHPLDGGRYIQTWGAIVTKDPNSGWQNVANYRGMIHDRNKMVMLITPSQHAWLHARRHEAQGAKSMPMAIALGCEPVTHMVSCIKVPEGVDEYDVIGAMRGEALPVVKCETVDLEVPATAEIVLEGELLLDPQTYLPEGPFGEYPGYYSKVGSDPSTVFQVNCVTHRKDPILHGMMAELSSAYPRFRDWSFLEIVPIWNALEDCGVPGITGVYGGDSHMTAHHILFVSINKMYYGHTRQVAAALWSGLACLANQGKIVVVVDSDVDISDTSQVLAAIANRVRPAVDIVIFPGCAGGDLDPSLSPEIRRMAGGIGAWDRVLIDATWPFEWQPRPEWGGLSHPPTCQSDEGMLAKVRERWSEYGLA